jgi:hypothetical protein
MVRRSTWIILAVFLVLLGSLLVFQKIKESETLDDQANPLADLGPLQPVETVFEVPSGEWILGLEIWDRDENKLEIIRENDDQEWKLISLEGEADQELINKVILQLESLSVDRGLDAGIDLEIIGIKDPAYTIQLLISNGGYFTIYVGNVTITKSTYYAQLKGSSPILVSKYSLDTVLNLLKTPPVLLVPIDTIEPNDGDGE